MLRISTLMLVGLVVLVLGAGAGQLAGCADSFRAQAGVSGSSVVNCYLLDEDNESEGPLIFDDWIECWEAVDEWFATGKVPAELNRHRPGAQLTHGATGQVMNP